MFYNLYKGYYCSDPRLPSRTVEFEAGEESKFLNWLTNSLQCSGDELWYIKLQ